MRTQRLQVARLREERREHADRLKRLWVAVAEHLRHVTYGGGGWVAFGGLPSGVLVGGHRVLGGWAPVVRADWRAHLAAAGERLASERLRLGDRARVRWRELHR